MTLNFFYKHFCCFQFFKTVNFQTLKNTKITDFSQKFISFLNLKKLKSNFCKQKPLNDTYLHKKSIIAFDGQQKILNQFLSFFCPKIKLYINLMIMILYFEGVKAMLPIDTFFLSISHSTSQGDMTTKKC